MRKRKLLVVLAGVSALLLGMPGSSAGGGIDTDIDPSDDVPTAFTSSPVTGSAGTTITFSGTGCPSPNEVFVGLFSGTPPVPPLLPPMGSLVVSDTVTPSGGAWSGSFVVPAGTPVGAFFVFADCFDPEESASGVSASSHDGLLGSVDYIPNVFILAALPTGGVVAVPATSAPAFGFTGDLGAAIPISGVPRFTG